MIRGVFAASIVLLGTSGCSGDGALAPPLEGGTGCPPGALNCRDIAVSDVECMPNPNVGQMLGGTVKLFTDDSFMWNTPNPRIEDFLGQAELTIKGAPCGFITTTVDSSFEGGVPPADAGELGAFRFDGGIAAGTRWLRTRQTDGDVMYPTMWSVLTDANVMGFDFAMMKRNELAKIYNQLGIELREDRGTIVMQAILAGIGLEPEPGAVFNVPGAEIVVYRAGGVWSLDATSTGPDGLAIAINVTGQPFPGAETTVVHGDTPFGIMTAPGWLSYVQTAEGIGF